MGPSVPDAAWLWDNEPCRAGCPVHTDAGAYVVAIAEGRFEDAYRIAREPNPFPSICGRVCAAPCESACRRGVIDAPVAIRALKRFVTEQFGVESFNSSASWHEAHGPLPEASLASVGVIGGGPAGLSAAHDLRRAGHRVTVYDSAPMLGGMMVLGIPEYRLPRELIRRETAAILDMGVEAKLSFQVGRDATLEDLLADHDAVFVAVGTSQARGLDLPGSGLDGIFRAIEYLLNVNRGFRVDLGQHVVVVGGGNVAFDAARTALRAAAWDEPTPPALVSTADDRHARISMATTLDVARAVRRSGVQHVTVIALESPQEIPADPDEIAEALDEGITIAYQRGPRRFVEGAPGSVGALETVAVSSVFDAQRRFAPTFVEGTEESIPADSVILAVGQSPNLDFLGDAIVERSPQGWIKVDPVSLRSSHPRIWAGGDVAHGPRNLIDAVADGARAAASIHTVLTGAVPPTRTVRVELRSRADFHRIASGYDGIGRVEVPAVAHERRIGFAEVELGYGADAAQREALRCLHCFDNIMLDPSLCILCGLCVDVCPPNCITIARADRLDLGSTAQSVLLLDEDSCIRCGLCVNRCPPGALSMVHAVEVSDG